MPPPRPGLPCEPGGEFGLNDEKPAHIEGTRGTPPPWRCPLRVRLPGRSREHAFLLALQRPLEERERGSLVAPTRLRRLVRFPGHELRPREQCALWLGSAVAGLIPAHTGGDGLRLDDGRLGLGRGPALVDQQRLGLRRDLLGLGEHRLDRAGVLVTRDDLPRQGEHEVVAIVPVGGEAVFGQLPLDGERGLELLRHELERVRL